LNEKVLMTGNEAAAEAAIRAGCRFCSAYPITPSSEFLEYMAHRLPQVEGIFIQSESEISAINMLFGASAAGKRAIVASSACGVALMQETISYLASTQLPGVIVNISRAGPGLGRITPTQADYWQMTKGGGNGDYQLVVLGPASVQEMAELTYLAFDLADKYRNPVAILADGMLGQMMEPVVLPKFRDLNSLPQKPWAVTGAKGRERNLVLVAPYTDEEMITLNEELDRKYRVLEAAEQRWEPTFLDDAELVIVAFGTAARIAGDVIERARNEGIKVGMIRPISLWPFPKDAFKNLEAHVRTYLVLEMSNGQIVDDVRLTRPGDTPVHHYGKGGGWKPTSKGVYEQILQLWRCIA